MSKCGRCGRDFIPADEIDLAGIDIPVYLRPLVAPYLKRLLVFRCPGPECRGLFTCLFLPPAQLADLPRKIEEAGDPDRQLFYQQGKLAQVEKWLQENPPPPHWKGSRWAWAATEAVMLGPFTL